MQIINTTAEETGEKRKRGRRGRGWGGRENGGVWGAISPSVTIF